MSAGASSEGSYRIPRLAHARVADAMRHGIFSCPADATVRDAARTMALHHVHTIIVTDPAGDAPVGVLSDVALIGALLDRREDRPLDEVAEDKLETVASDEPLAAAAQLMRERGTAHLVVRDAHSGRPTGMLSTLDVAGVLAWGEA
jgi:CBS domain-containing protein